MSEIYYTDTASDLAMARHAEYQVAMQGVVEACVNDKTGFPWPSEPYNTSHNFASWLAAVNGELAVSVYDPSAEVDFDKRALDAIGKVTADLGEVYLQTIKAQSGGFTRRWFELVRSSRRERALAKLVAPAAGGLANFASKGVVGQAFAASGFTFLGLWAGTAFGRQIFGSALRSATRGTVGRTLDSFCQKVSDENFAELKNQNRQYKQATGKNLNRHQRAEVVRKIEVQQKVDNLASDLGAFTLFAKTTEGFMDHPRRNQIWALAVTEMIAASIDKELGLDGNLAHEYYEPNPQTVAKQLQLV